MPELADVEGFRRVLAEHAQGAPVTGIAVHDSQVLRGFSASDLRELLCGHAFDPPRRHGKWLIVPISGTEHHLLVHFGMTGALVWAGDGEVHHRHDRVVFTVHDGELRYRDMRKLKGLYLAGGRDDVSRQLGDLGPDAFEVSAEQLSTRLRAHARPVKPALFDQSLLAGLGNLLADEVLWQARLNPGARTTGLGDTEYRRLHQKLRTVLRQSARAGRVPSWPSWLSGHRDDPEGRCPRCGARLNQQRISSRASVWCPRCQPADS